MCFARAKGVLNPARLSGIGLTGLVPAEARMESSQVLATALDPGLTS